MDRLIIRGGTVIDGTGRPGFTADVEVKGGVITAVAKDLPAGAADKVLDAEGFAVAPGFIDAHAHSDTAFLKDDSGASKLFQGITTEISGNCGSSPFPYPDGKEEAGSWRCASFGEFLDRFDREKCRMAVNQAMLVGHGSLRESVIGEADRQATQAELERMRRLLDADLRQGAWGMSLGLEYAPGFFADTRELSFLARTVKEHGGIVTCHMRSEGLRIDEAVEELVSVGRESDAHVHISHLKLDNHSVHGRAREVWERVESARRNGVNITADVYPYTASSTTLTIRCPRWSLDGGNEKLLDRLGGPQRGEIVEGIRAHYPTAARAETCLFSDDGGYWPEIVGKTLREVAETMLGTRDYAEAAARVIERTRAKAWCVFFVMSEADMLYFLSRDVSV
ncbi:MAG: amidohydrolase family protein, partial [Clostridia bacterium]|nr:amidohydrolase family protein [Clostridia bacterium]